MKRVLFREGFKINSIQDLVPGNLNVRVVNIYDVEDLPYPCYIGREAFTCEAFRAMVKGLLYDDKKYVAIKIVRIATGWTSKESERFVDSL